jgi:hypothetical protein
MDLGSFLLPLGVFLIWVAWTRRWAQPVLMIAALGSLLHLTSHLRDAGHSQKAVAADIFSLLLLALFWPPFTPVPHPASDQRCC